MMKQWLMALSALFLVVGCAGQDEQDQRTNQQDHLEESIEGSKIVSYGDEMVLNVHEDDIPNGFEGWDVEQQEAYVMGLAAGLEVEEPQGFAATATGCYLDYVCWNFKEGNGQIVSIYGNYTVKTSDDGSVTRKIESPYWNSTSTLSADEVENIKARRQSRRR